MADEDTGGVTHWRQYLDSKTLGVGDFPDPAADWIVRIVKVTGGNVAYADGAQKKSMIHFEGVKKHLAAGATICEAIEKLYSSPNPRKWYGKLVALYADKCNAFGKAGTDCVRVRNKKPPDDGAGAQTGSRAPYDLDSAIDRIKATRDDAELTAMRAVITAEKPPSSCRPAIKVAIEDQIALFAKVAADDAPATEAAPL